INTFQYNNQLNNTKNYSKIFIIKFPKIQQKIVRIFLKSTLYSSISSFQLNTHFQDLQNQQTAKLLFFSFLKIYQQNTTLNQSQQVQHKSINIYYRIKFLVIVAFQLNFAFRVYKKNTKQFPHLYLKYFLLIYVLHIYNNQRVYFLKYHKTIKQPNKSIQFINDFFQFLTYKFQIEVHQDRIRLKSTRILRQL
ncbi:hypothetical protein IMG5_162950, partial [Ichthyophthirius multifiliis]